MSQPVILASASEARAEMLRAAGVDVVVEPARVDEDAVKAALRAEGAPPRDQADKLAEMKAIRVSSRRPGALVIGADQVLELDGEAFDKPAGIDEARAQLNRLRGQRHELHAAAAIAVNGAPVWRHVARARLFMRGFSADYLEAYLARMGAAVTTTVG
ncbi:MAG: Maf family protein, partial [Pseudomonadota bacterium]